jgi:hypothetical protein
MPAVCDQYGMEPSMCIRLAEVADTPALQRVAERDSRLVPAGDLLVGLVGGEIRAALSLSSGESIADPFHPTAALVELLGLHAKQARDERPGTRDRVGKLALRSAET